MDEPLSNLDAKLRVRSAPRSYASSADLGWPQSTSLTRPNRSNDNGRSNPFSVRANYNSAPILRVVYDHPDNLFTAAFIGSPAMNLFEGGLSADGRTLVVGDQHLELVHNIELSRPGSRLIRTGRL